MRQPIPGRRIAPPPGTGVPTTPSPVALALALALTGGLLVGCGSNVPPPPAPTSGASAPATADPSSPATPSAPTGTPTAPTAPTAPTTSPTTPPAAGPLKAPPRKRFHRGPGQTYRFENSPRGIAFARANGYLWIDIDCNYTLGRLPDGRPGPLTLIATHWDKIDTEGFDPQGRYGPDTRWSDLTWDQARVLRTAERPPYRVLTMEEMFRRLAAAGFEGVEWEVKTGAAFEDPATYRPLLALATRLGLKVEVKTLYALGGRRASFRRMRAAHEAGAVTMLVKPPGRPAQIPPHAQAWIDFVRGPWVPVA